MKQYTYLIIVIFFPVFCNGQTVGFSYGLGSLNSQSLHTASAQYRHLGFSFLDSKLEVKPGVRYSNYFREIEQDLSSSKQTFVSSVDVHSLNLLLETEYGFLENLLVGMNIDLVGFSFGTEKDIRTTAGASGKTKPASVNLLLGGKNDKGALNSEFFIAYRVNSDWKIRAGLSHQVVEYETALSTEKAQRFFDLFFIGIDRVL